MTTEETLALTHAMVDSGETLRFSRIQNGVDKHSTGGVGDTTTLLAVPLLAACGEYVPKLSGRALAHTGGTLDKLESVPGFRSTLEPSEFERIVAKVGCAIAAQSSKLVPADKVLYALRDRTGTVPAPGLIAASIVSKKVAGGASRIVYDVKAGAGGFARSVDDARTLALSLLTLTAAFGRQAGVVVSDMSQPLSPAVGTGMEVMLARDLLAGRSAAPRLMRVVRAVVLEGLGGRHSPEDAARAYDRALASGEGLERLRAMVEAQGGEGGALSRLQPVAASRRVAASRDGFVRAIDPVLIGRTARHVVNEAGPFAGVRLLKIVGAEVESGEPVAVVYGGDDVSERAVAAAYEIGAEPSADAPAVYEELALSIESTK